ncbi:MAG: ROK family protein, partial [Candidatus Omnitrophica bacterium]|nr:ROK family protein [Candidatus Omnitrophota bacterium]
MEYYIGVDIGATNIKIGLLDANFKILRKKKLYTPIFSNKEELIEALVKNITLLKKTPKCKIKGVGIGLPGLINHEKGLVYRLVNISGWNNVYLKKILESRIGLPVFIDNDVNVMTLAEVRCGRARGAKNVVCITLGTGVGGGIVIEGKLYRGATFSAGEIGHIPLNEEGPLCNCGGKGCL